jgi:hypothetical protein
MVGKVGKSTHLLMPQHSFPVPTAQLQQNACCLSPTIAEVELHVLIPYFSSLHGKGFEILVPQTSGDLPAALTVATATAISVADNGSKGWLLWALVMIGIPACFPSNRSLVQLKHATIFFISYNVAQAIAMKDMEN